jgi:hypothetical protein
VKSRHFDSRFVRKTLRITQAGGVALLWVSLFATEGFAQSVDTAWKTETRLYLSGMSFYWETNGDSTKYETLAATGELRFSPAARSWYASLFADYRFSWDGRHTDHVNLGGLLNYGRNKWDARTYFFVNKSPQSSDTWIYAGRLRYRVAENHRIGIEAYGSLNNSHKPELMLGYYGDISDSVSLNLALGPVTKSGPDFSARLELIWQVF